MSAKKVIEKAAQTVSPRQWIRLVMVYLLIPLILFICGGDFGWWQAWLYSMLILASGIGGRIWAEKRHPGLTAERQNIENIQNAKAWDKVLAPLMAVSVVFPMVIVAGLDHRFNWSLEFPLWLSVVGFIFIAFGYAFGAWALAKPHVLRTCPASPASTRFLYPRSSRGQANFTHAFAIPFIRATFFTGATGIPPVILLHPSPLPGWVWDLSNISL
jgi:hypothetical protein